jgi:imidazolonepropionase
VGGTQAGSSGAAVAASLITPKDPLPVRGARSGPAEIAEGAIAWEDGVITYVGPAGELPREPTEGDPSTGCLVPGFVDCHVHLPFAGWRADEFEARLAGVSYRDLHGAEGGIFRSSRQLREASDDQVIEFCLPLLREMAAHGTTALELKTGYGLGLEQELRQARLARRLSAEAPQSCSVTLLAAHAVPQNMTRADWIRVATRELIPAAAAEGLVDAVDIYVEDIAFSLADLASIAAAADLAELPLRVHADQLGASGAAEAAVALGARSADHLNKISARGVEALGMARATVAVLLPASTFFLRAEPAPASKLREAGAAIAIATDLNPGTSPIASMPEAIAMACTVYGMEPAVALTGATANAAWVLGMHTSLGTLEVGKRADFLILQERAFVQVPYRPGHNPVAATFINGIRV